MFHFLPEKKETFAYLFCAFTRFPRWLIDSFPKCRRHRALFVAGRDDFFDAGILFPTEFVKLANSRAERLLFWGEVDPFYGSPSDGPLVSSFPVFLLLNPVPESRSRLPKCGVAQWKSFSSGFFFCWERECPDDVTFFVASFGFFVLPSTRVAVRSKRVVWILLFDC